jgi:hypothetical protein
MGIFNKLRGGAGSQHQGSGRMDFPHANPAPQMYTWGNQPPKNEPRPNSDNTAFSQPAPSGRGKYLIHGSAGGGYVTTTPTQGKEDRHDVTYWSNDDKEQYSVSGARFKHDADEGTASFYGGTEQGSGRQMGHMWSKPTWGGNIHQDQ